MLFEEGYEIRGAIGHRRVDADIAGLDLIARAQHMRPVLALIVHVALLGERDQLAQDLDIGLAVGLGADQDLDDLLEIEQPEGQRHVVRA